MRREVLRLEHVTYKEKETIFLKDFDLNIFEGEIMGLLPVGAYGLTAFIKVITEYPPLYHGYIYYREKLVDSWVSEQHANNRICFIGDKSSLVDGQDVLSNVMILRSGYHQEIIHHALLLRQFEPFLQETGISINPDMLVEKLSNFERIIVEILRAVVANNRLIVLQEVGTLLTDEELKRLFQIIHHYVEKGFSFLYISPHYEELKQICHRIAIMMDSSICKVLKETDMETNVPDQCANEYIMRVQERRNQREKCTDKVVFAMEDVTGEYICYLNLQVHQGECLVVQCLDQCIATEFLQILQEETKPSGGRITYNGHKKRRIDTRKIAVILQQPWESMIFNEMSIYDNLCLCMDHRVSNIWHSAKIRESICNTFEEQMGKDIFGKSISELSKSEKCELVYTRILLQKPEVVFCIQPFKGGDVSHRILIWELQKRLLDRGCAIVIVAVNMADALSLADRVVRIDRDTKVTEYKRSEFHLLPSTVPWYSLYQGTE